MRLNGAPTAGFEKYVGSRTTLRYTHGGYFGWREHEGEVPIAKWQGRTVELIKLLRKRIHPINPAFIRYSRNDFFTAKGHLPTQGMRALLMLVHKCIKWVGATAHKDYWLTSENENAGQHIYFVEIDGHCIYCTKETTSIEKT
eukprot:gene3418-4298_t